VGGLLPTAFFLLTLPLHAASSVHVPLPACQCDTEVAGPFPTPACCRHTTKGLELLDTAIQQEPSLIELHTTRAKLLKHAGDREGGCARKGLPKLMCSAGTLRQDAHNAGQGISQLRDGRKKCAGAGQGCKGRVHRLSCARAVPRMYSDARLCGAAACCAAG